jgi:hypothetical protein
LNRGTRHSSASLRGYTARFSAAWNNNLDSTLGFVISSYLFLTGHTLFSWTMVFSLLINERYSEIGKISRLDPGGGVGTGIATIIPDIGARWK